MPQDFRERKGSFYTPTIWVQKSQEAITKVLGENWQSEYYIWDCCCGTGNLLAGFTEPYRIFASDIEQANIKALHSMIESKSIKLLENHCFQFDFLQDSFEKLLPINKEKIQHFFDTLPKKLEEPLKEIVNIENEKISPKKLQKNIEKIKKIKQEIINNFDEESQESINNVFNKLPEELPNLFRDILENDFNKLPPALYKIIKEEPQKLIIYINPPYKEATNIKETTGTGKAAVGVSFTKTKTNYKDLIGVANNELYAQFLFRIYKEIPNCKIANFSTLKNLQGSNFKKFRQHFTPKLKSLFLVPADTFDNVNGKFPIGFFIWDGLIKEVFTKTKAHCFDKNGKNIGTKNIHSLDNVERINKWILSFDDKENEGIGYLTNPMSDFQSFNLVQIMIKKGIGHFNYYNFTKNNLFQGCIYFAVRKVIPHTWQNDRDQFLYPNEKWKQDAEFQNDCLAYTLFHTSNNIKSEFGTNHWIPFYENEVKPKAKFESNFIADFIAGKIKNTEKQNGFEGMEKECFIPKEKITFSKEAKAVFEAGKELFKYYHTKSDVNVNASLYDIRGYFQGFKTLANGKKRMNPKSKDVEYNKILKNLKTKLQLLGDKIAPKIYDYGFLLK